MNHSLSEDLPDSDIVQNNEIAGARFSETAISGQVVYTLPCQIIKSLSLDYMTTRHRDAIPGLYYKEYILKNPTRPVSFHPKQACHNLLNLCCYIDEHGWEADARRLLRKLVGEIEAHMRWHDDALFVTYPFSYEELGKRLEAEWSCALGQAFLLGAWIKLYRTTREQRFLDYAHSTHASLARFREFPGQEAPWVTFVDDRGFLWFEEYPSDQDPQTCILNGHIYTIMGLYSYYLLQGGQETLRLMQAGMATVLQYFQEFRRIGRVNRYSLLPASGPDYMPSRSVLQQKWLFDVSADHVFNQQYLAFKSDMGWSLARPGEEYYHAS